MELSDVLHQMIQEGFNATQPCDLCIGTVTSAAPLEITIDTAMEPLRSAVLYLSASVIERKIPVVEHTHAISDTYTGGGSAGNALSSIRCYENGKPLPVKGGYIILNRGLELGDEVLLLRVQHGQKFIVLSRTFKEGT